MKRELDLGRLLGRREAFTVLAGRCTAADAAILRDIRDQKLYEGFADDWGSFCSEYLHISKTAANRIIQLLNEFGSQYFEVAQLTRISARRYRLIAPLIWDGALHKDGEAIALIPDNAERFNSVVAELDPPVAREAKAGAVSSLREDCRALLRRFDDTKVSGEDRLELHRILTEMMEGLVGVSLRLTA
jgi:hypothetical protein